MSYSFDNVKLCKGMYREGGKNFSTVLEEADPSEQYRGTALEGMDAFQRQLKRFDIRVKGPKSDPVEKFFKTADSAVLFPEFLGRAVRQGMEEKNILPSITAAVTKFDGLDYRTIASVPDDEQKELKKVAEGAEIPETRVMTQQNLVKLIKRGRMLVASYEAIRYQRLDLFSVTLRQIGSHIMNTHLKDAVDTVLSGDGNGNPAPVLNVGDGVIGGTAGTLTYDELLAFWSAMSPYELNTILASRDVVLSLLKLAQFQNPEAGLNFQGTGKLVTPLGATLIPTPSLPAGTLIGLDRRYALEMVTGSDLEVEFDKLIDRQLERAAIVSVAGFAKIFSDASKVLKI